MMSTAYWTSTLLISGFLLLSVYTYFFSAATIAGLKELGFPDFFRIQLGLMKMLAVAVLLVPGLPPFAKEWAYAGVGFFLITALVAHLAHQDSVFITILLLFLMGVLAISRYTWGML